ncbi:Aste57867_15995 [Aphanomyces stellatus]|uniref:Aste57867_15995 protein n=1 Tax=Aphanomyces stellatus TaxID=120398 RepID=A0A485L5E0_9STRA|nr:hypothetical protein As57867_015939 [Aphanomyces stellatus]VFT92780.1 Aste57867_15995 [Aphanomyces stellatus]
MAVGDNEKHHLAERVRLRKYRLEKKSQKQALASELKHLQDKFNLLKSSYVRPNYKIGASSAYAYAIDILKQHNRGLQTQVEHQAMLVRLLTSWVASQCPQKPPSMRMAWTESTLMAHPAARRQGFQWLSARLYHTALETATQRLTSSRLFGSHMDDAVSFEMHTTCDADGNVQIARMDSHFNCIFFANMHVVVAALWSFMNGITFGTSAMLAPEAVDLVHAGKLVYDHSVNPRDGTSLRRIMCLFEDDNRVVITFTKIRDDERYPLQPGDRRTHGFAWMIVDRVTDSITTVRNSNFNFMPTTVDGDISLEETGRLFGLTVEATTNIQRDLLVERIRGVAERASVDEFHSAIQRFRQSIGC